MDFDIPAQLGGMPQLFELLCEDADLWRARFIAIELLALLYEDSDFIFRFLPEGGKLPPVLNMVLENEFNLFNPLLLYINRNNRAPADRKFCEAAFLQEGEGSGWSEVFVSQPGEEA